MNEGWVKVHRKTLNNPVVCKDSDHLAIWIYLLLNANHEEIKVVFGGQKISLLPGQLLTSRNKISKDLKINASKVYRILNCFEIEQQIEQRTDRQQSLIVIDNWGLYQMENEQRKEQRVNNDRTTKQKKGEKTEKMFSPHTPFSKEKNKESKKNCQECKKYNTTTTTTREDKLKYQIVSIGTVENGGCAELLISDSQIAKLKQELSHDELAHYLNRMDDMILNGYKFGCSHYEYIMQMAKRDRGKNTEE